MKMRHVAGLDNPLKVMFQATTRVLASYVSAALPWPGVCTAGTSWAPVNGTSNNTGRLALKPAYLPGQAANGRKTRCKWVRDMEVSPCGTAQAGQQPLFTRVQDLVSGVGSPRWQATGRHYVDCSGGLNAATG